VLSEVRDLETVADAPRMAFTVSDEIRIAAA
jgi:hypothetical protein